MKEEKYYIKESREINSESTKKYYLVLNDEYLYYYKGEKDNMAGIVNWMELKEILSKREVKMIENKQGRIL